ncbi:MAG: calcium-binding protein, partial [Candidatus Zixiibacteriota bacterium]
MRSSIDYTLGANIEDLTLEDASLIGSGNEMDNLITGNDGNNTLAGEGGNDTLHGLAGNDHLAGGQGADRLYGDIGDDVLDGGEGADRMYGGLGADTYYVDNALDSVVELGSLGTLQKGDSAVDTVISSVNYVLPKYTYVYDFMQRDILSE